MVIPCPDCAHDRPGEIHRAGGVYSLCPTCDGEGTLEKLQSLPTKADISPGTQPPGYSEFQELSTEEREARIRGRELQNIVSLTIQLQALTKRVEKLEAGEFGK